jgi:Mycoplasma protein of unknown function, DUF285
MFYFATSFNQDIGQWNVGNGPDFSYMFVGATSFNQDIEGWNVSNGIYFGGMFADAPSFNRDLCLWGGQINQFADVTGMFNRASACAATADPVLRAMPPGPFCAVCLRP